MTDPKNDLSKWIEQTEEDPPEKELAALDFDVDFKKNGRDECVQKQIEKTEKIEQTEKITLVPSVDSFVTDDTDSLDDREEYQQFEVAKKETHHKPGNKKLELKALDDQNDLRVLHYGIFGLLYILSLLGKMDFSFFFFPTFLIITGTLGLKMICQFFLSRQALTWSEALYALGFIIGIYMLFYPLLMLSFRGTSVVYLYISNVFINAGVLGVASALGIKLSTNYEWTPIAWVAPVVAIWLLAVSRLGIHFFGF